MTPVMLREQIARGFALALDKLEEDLAFTARHPALVDGLAGTLAQLHVLKTPIPDYALILDRAAELQARVAIEKARA
jgi:hypothetical protein